MNRPLTDLGFIDQAAILGRYLDPGKLDRYYSVLMDHNSRVNLVSRETSRVDFDRLVAESLLPLDQIKTPVASYIDIGAGGGFPSFPILLSGRVSDGAHLIERTEKKARALKTMLTQLSLNAQVIPRNLEEVKDLSPVSLITLRLVKLDRLLLARLVSLLQPGGILVYYSQPEFPVTTPACETFTFRSSQLSEPKSFTIFKK